MPGTKYDDGKLRLDLLPPEWIFGLAQVLTMGAAKYGDRNWQEGIEWERLFGAAQRHAWTWASGESTDPESGLNHLLHMAWNALALYYYETHSVGKDFRV